MNTAPITKTVRRFGVNTGSTVRELPGNYTSIEEVKALRIFKDHPNWIAVELEKPPVKARPKRTYAKESPEILARRKELRHCNYMLEKLIPMRDSLYIVEKSAKKLMHNDAGCGLHTDSTDYWVSTSIALDNLIRTIASVQLRKKQLSNLFAQKK
jgi:hypothetical protein